MQIEAWLEEDFKNVEEAATAYFIFSLDMQVGLSLYGFPKKLPQFSVYSFVDGLRFIDFGAKTSEDLAQSLDSIATEYYEGFLTPELKALVLESLQKEAARYQEEGEFLDDKFKETLAELMREEIGRSKPNLPDDKLDDLTLSGLLYRYPSTTEATWAGFASIAAIREREALEQAALKKRNADFLKLPLEERRARIEEDMRGAIKLEIGVDEATTLKVLSDDVAFYKEVFRKSFEAAASELPSALSVAQTAYLARRRSLPSVEIGILPVQLPNSVGGFSTSLDAFMAKAPLWEIYEKFIQAVASDEVILFFLAHDLRSALKGELEAWLPELAGLLSEKS